MAKTVVDTETKTAEGLDAAYETTKRGRGWKFWVIAPVVLALVAGGAFLGVRRILGSPEK
ncbi:MAG TPA: hypothetical protein VFA09_02995 [Ktedonobacteraceae bacterium]|nr:hypothetical protein [Ktedonobacteraceae bacterium]